jgi:hypothetical protein
MRDYHRQEGEKSREQTQIKDNEMKMGVIQ